MRFVIPLLCFVACAFASPVSQAKGRTCGESITFSNPAAEAFKVNRTLPGIPFRLNTSYAGNIPVSKNDTSRQLYFWMFPADEPSNTTIIWNNGGPGCSSLEGLMQENGPFALPFNSTKVVKSQYSWTRLANVIWVEHPVSVGFTKGKASVANEDDVSRDFVGFLDNFFDIFQEMKGQELWLTGESYAGMYIMYIANAIFQRSVAVNKAAGINLQGVNVNDPSITGDAFGEEIPSVPYAIAHQKDLKLSDAFISDLVDNAKKHGIYDYIEKNLLYPPPGPLTVPAKAGDFQNYSPWSDIIGEAYRQTNGSFNVYDTRPAHSWYPLTDPLGFPPNENVASADNFLNNIKGFKEAIHADPSITWKECSDKSPFRGGVDRSPPPDITVMGQVIEKSKRTLIQHGLQDYVLIANGTRLSIQNTTFHGLQGFQTAPSRRLIVDGSDAGVFHEERGLTYVEITDSGHMIPQDYPAAAFKTLQYLVGQISLDELAK
ncbi:unnamed protein product [Tilletia controversa]|uniref:Carboxypeptidase n=1 Tax=Tilletia controversa TaxID=13291 RepID=A0A8X7MLW7_9BASI|nr:hypothetical protein CF328_g6290 [Tilletia controversa]KAE8240278.1 hypothetical protein A4X06_0g7834 [Tilletia controversa]CAD6908721.1 unnamed protein product [Tilletia controversa]CAD6950438.1 unnamed protein product [Tilletia controversa]CAD6960393.1 unnamed protein product [Tilletia controversa]